MRKASLLAAIVLASSGATVSAQQIAGSDTLEVISKNIIETVCNESPALTYGGGGSSTGENAMLSGAQDFAPMSRPLKCSVSVGAGRSSCAIHVADDALAVFRSTPGAGSACTNVTRDVLRQIYFGAGPTGNGAGSDCGNATRRSLISNWGSVFGQAGCAGESCTTLRHAFRRNDLSGTTDTFRDRLGISVSGCTGVACAVPFCNGNDASQGQVQADNDPIRTSCSGSEDVCGPIPRNPAFGTRNLGVVQSIYVPAQLIGGSTAADLFANTQACAPGRFKFLPHPGAPTSPCPNGGPARAGLCLTPVTAANQANCIAGPQAPAGSTAGFDGRAFNAILRNAAGNIRLTQPVAPATTVRVTSAMYRLHIGGLAGASCTDFDATQQIGCLTAADPCTVGFAGFGGKLANNDDLSVNGVNALLNPTTPNPNYLLYRKLFVNGLNCNVSTGAITQEGTGASRTNQNTAFQCFRDRNAVANAVNIAGFFPVSGSGPLPLEPLTNSNCAP